MDNLNKIEDTIDIREDDIALLNHGLVLKELLTDQTRKKILQEKGSADEAFIFWGTSDYEFLGGDYSETMEIKPDLVTGEERGKIIMPRVLKEKQQQIARSKDKAEVFTPSWVCNAQNNLIDEAWFGCPGMFNTEITDEDGHHSWSTTDVVDFSKTAKTWQEYVRDTRMEITCGEAPYLISRYDTTTGEYIPVKDRIGLLDRKLRVINENTSSYEEWFKYVVIAYRNTYGYEWQGDSLLLAREGLLRTFIDYFRTKFGADRKIHPNTLQCIANIISWNIWQMDGLKFVIPYTEYDEEIPGEETLFGQEAPTIIHHDGICPLLRDWILFDDYHKDKQGLKGRERCDIPFTQLCK